MKKILGAIMMMAMVGLSMFMPTRVYAACPEGSVQTSILGEKQSDGTRCMKVGEEGEGIFSILNIVLTVMTFGVGILATIGIVISGYQYITAKDDASKVQKAKDRLLQIVIGLAVYAVMWGLLQFLLPGGLFGNGN